MCVPGLYISLCYHETESRWRESKNEKRYHLIGVLQIRIQVEMSQHEKPNNQCNAHRSIETLQMESYEVVSTICV
jgi:hypothetical protein